MSSPSPDPARFSVKRYLELTECGIVAPDERMELLEGLIVSMAAQSAPHAATVHRVEHALLRKLPARAVVRTQMTFLAGEKSVPEPDIAVVEGPAEAYFERHPSQAHLIVEVAESSLVQDRLTKSAIYARAGVECYWIVNLRDRCVERFRRPHRWRAEYEETTRATGKDELAIDAYPGIVFEAAELLPPSPSNESR